MADGERRPSNSSKTVPAKKAGVPRQAKPKPKKYEGRPNTAAAQGRAIAFTTEDEFIDRFNDPAEDDGTRGMLRHYTDGFRYTVSKPTPKFPKKPKNTGMFGSASAPALDAPERVSLVSAPAPPPKVVVERAEPAPKAPDDADSEESSVANKAMTQVVARVKLSKERQAEIDKERKDARRAELAKTSLGDALRELMADWASTTEGGAILRHVPALPLGIFDDADHVEVAGRAWKRRPKGSANERWAVALRSDDIGEEDDYKTHHHHAVDSWTRRLGTWCPCVVLTHGDESRPESALARLRATGEDHLVEWADKYNVEARASWAAQAWVPAVAVVGVWQDRFTAAARLQGALARRAACEERLRLRHFFESAPESASVVAPLFADLFPKLPDAMRAMIVDMPRARLSRAELLPEVAAQLREIERDYGVAMRGHVFGEVAKAGRDGGGPAVDRWLLSSDKTLDLDALDAVAVCVEFNHWFGWS